MNGGERDLLEALVRIPSPTGQEAEAVAFLQDTARADGLRVRTDRVGNLVAEAGDPRGPLLLFVGHVDTVPGHIPVRVEGGELWGRGSVDAKGCLAAAYCAARRHLDGPARIMVVGAVDEEGRSAGVKALPRDLDPRWMVVGEPSGADGVTLGYKGILRCTLRAERDAVHGAHADEGATDAAVSFWCAVRERFGAGAGFDVVQARLDGLSTVQDGLRDAVTGQFQLRLPPGLSPEAAQRALREVAAAHGVEVSVHEAMAAAVADPRSPLASALRASIRAGGMVPRLKHKTGTADFNHLAAWYPGVPLAAYGPGDSSLDHRPDERLELREFDAAVGVLDRVFGRFSEATRRVEVGAVARAFNPRRAPPP